MTDVGDIAGVRGAWGSSAPATALGTLGYWIPFDVFTNEVPGLDGAMSMFLGNKALSFLTRPNRIGYLSPSDLAHFSTPPDRMKLLTGEDLLNMEG